MNTADFKTICLETLNAFHGFKHKGDRLVFKNMKCCFCQKPVNIEIVKTASGFGLLNGNVSEPEDGQILVQCAECARKLARKATAPIT